MKEIHSTSGSMPQFRQLTSAQQCVEAARWLMMLPVAWIVGTVLHPLVGVILRTIPGRGGMESLSFWVRTIPYYVVPQMAMAVIGACIAPRKPLLGALLLTLLFGVLSLMKHVIVQAQAGNTVGAINYIHFGLESAGLLAGLVCVRRWSTYQRMP